MEIVQAVVITVMDLHVSCLVRHGNLSIKGPEEPLVEVVEHAEGALEEALLVVALLMDQHVNVREESKARTNAEHIVGDKKPPFKAICRASDGNWGRAGGKGREQFWEWKGCWDVSQEFGA